jgi:hypothetical protein
MTEPFDPALLPDVEDAPSVEPEPEPQSHSDEDESDKLPDEPDE